MKTLIARSVFGGKDLYNGVPNMGSIIGKLLGEHPELKSELKAFNQLFADSSNISVKKTNVSSIFGDFSPVFYKNGLIYATKSKNTEVLIGRYKWDNSYYVSLMESDFASDSTIGNGKLLRHQFLDKAHDGPVAFTKDQLDLS